MFEFKPKVPFVNVEDFKKMLDEKSEFILLDVRTHREFSIGKIRNSINLPVDEIESKVKKIIQDKNKMIYVYCLSGSRSALAVEKMLKLGYNNVFDIKSGLLAWRAKQYPLEN